MQVSYAVFDAAGKMIGDPFDVEVGAINIHGLSEKPRFFDREGMGVIGVIGAAVMLFKREDLGLQFALDNLEAKKVFGLLYFGSDTRIF